MNHDDLFNQENYFRTEQNNVNLNQRLLSTSRDHSIINILSTITENNINTKNNLNHNIINKSEVKEDKKENLGALSPKLAPVKNNNLRKNSAMMSNSCSINNNNIFQGNKKVTELITPKNNQTNRLLIINSVKDIEGKFKFDIFLNINLIFF